MRLLLSFFLSFFIYSGILFFFISFTLFNQNREESKTIYVHQVISNIKQQKNKTKIKQVRKQIKKVKKENNLKKEKIKENKTKDTISKGGEEIKFDDIFANTSSKIPTTKIKHKKRDNMTKKIGKTTKNSEIVKKNLSNLYSSVSISAVYSIKKDSDFISNEFGRVWGELSTKDGDFISLKVNIKNGVVDFVVNATNLDTILLNKFLTDLKKIDTSKIQNFRGTINFNTKLKGNL